MKPVFVDTGCWIALTSPSDLLHEVAFAVMQRLSPRPLLTSEMILTEFLDGAADRGSFWRIASAQYVRDLQAQETVRILPMSSELFDSALDLYRQRPDKAWSLTDCASIHICQQEGITEVLTHDRHFQQAGFVALLRE